MNNHSRIIFIIISFLFTVNIVFPQKPDTEKWVGLFNGKDLSGWSSFLSTVDKEEPFLINEDPQKIFQVIGNELHFYKDQNESDKVPEGYLYTTKEYSDFRLRLEYKWGTKKFAQRKNKLKNSGLMFNAQQPYGFWPTSIEYQISEGITGDAYTQNYAWFTTTIDSIVLDNSSKRSFPRYSPNGKLYDYGGNQSSMRLIGPGNLDHPEGWNKVEMIVRGDSAVFYVNGTETVKVWNIRYDKPGIENDVRPMKKGRIVLQAEATEIIFRSIEILEE
ncbi:MAG: DUF1080 domain-containing protein [Melioribacteraceae bacterium]|nr:DUF1080 domain-containing protein [Melioribacteraceae bacterium]